MGILNKLPKFIGISLGALVIAGVATTTIIAEKKTSDSNSIVASSQMGINKDGSIINDNTSPSQNIPKTPVSTPRSSYRDDDDEDESDEDDGGGAKPPVPIPTPVPVDMPKKGALAYKNGTYSAVGTYMSPGGQDQINVTLVLKNDIITNATVTSKYADNTSLRYQDKFISGYQAYVVGQDISTVHLTRVSGSSLTPAGFNDALAKIKSQAKV